MILDELGQTFQYGPNKFKIGDIAVSYAGTDLGLCGFIREIDASDASCPTALLDLGCSDSKVLPLRDLTVLAAETSVETGRQYVLHYICDGSEGQQARVLGISSSKNVLLHMMLEDIENDNLEIYLTSAHMDEKEDSLWFNYENDEPAAPFYLTYEISSVPVYSKMEGGVAI